MEVVPLLRNLELTRVQKPEQILASQEKHLTSVCTYVDRNHWSRGDFYTWLHVGESEGKLQNNNGFNDIEI